jgi:hypothetical protein
MKAGKLIGALLASFACASIALAGTTISDTIKIFDGTAFSGSVSITGPAMTNLAGQAIARGTNSYTVTAGAFSVTLEPNDTATPANTSYVVRYFPASGQGWQEIWFVPTSSSALHLADVRLTTSATAGMFIQPMQIGPGGATNGQFLTWNATAMHWAPSNGPSLPVALSQVAGGGASDGQMLRWNASAMQWVPVTLADQVTPAGTIDGTNATFTLPAAPNPAAGLVLFRNGMAMKNGFDYTLSGATITWLSGAIPEAGDTLLAWYRY